MKHEGSVLVVQIAAGNAGIDLSRASIAIYYSLTFSLSDYEQSISRLYRPGQKNQVSLIHILAENTVDEKILDALVHKRSIVDDVLTRGVEAV
jgi:SNF2 family DNA or RNA helicase